MIIDSSDRQLLTALTDDKFQSLLVYLSKFVHLLHPPLVVWARHKSAPFFCVQYVGVLNLSGAKFDSMRTTKLHSEKVVSETLGHIMDVGMPNSPQVAGNAIFIAI